VREAERAWFLSEGEESEALIRVVFDTLGQKQRVFEPYSLSLSSMVAAALSQNLLQSRIWGCLLYQVTLGQYLMINERRIKSKKSWGRIKKKAAIYSSGRNRSLLKNGNRLSLKA
jgi:hypothetical protein